MIWEYLPLEPLPLLRTTTTGMPITTLTKNGTSGLQSEMQIVRVSSHNVTLTASGRLGERPRLRACQWFRRQVRLRLDKPDLALPSPPFLDPFQRRRRQVLLIYSQALLTMGEVHACVCYCFVSFWLHGG